ncbi:MAG: PD40 domain-containing protein [Saprospiraceae bacterium]|nr:PD40 domain-containing protein [Saprospiraceae bacterium]
MIASHRRWSQDHRLFFGGKGCFEVNGWSPDGSKITFVSNGIRTQ